MHIGLSGRRRIISNITCERLSSLSSFNLQNCHTPDHHCQQPLQKSFSQQQHLQESSFCSFWWTRVMSCPCFPSTSHLWHRGRRAQQRGRRVRSRGRCRQLGRGHMRRGEQRKGGRTYLESLAFVPVDTKNFTIYDKGHPWPLCSAFIMFLFL